MPGHNIKTPIVKTYISMRVVKAMNPELAKKAVENGDFDEKHPKNDTIVLEKELFPNVIETCPMCGALTLEYKKLKTQGIPHSKDFDYTHIWVCEDCPFVGFEFYVKENAQTLTQYLSK
jgi:DNA-directed RNA polymerase subunit M/transcription elongation factor TFIIS